MPNYNGYPVYARTTAQKLNVTKQDAFFFNYSRVTSQTTGTWNTVVEPYKTAMSLPGVVVVHPYAPLDGAAYDEGIVKIFAALNVETANLESLQKELGVANITSNIVVQSNPWDDQQQLLLRPHPWAHHFVPHERQPEGQTKEYSIDSNLDVSIYTLPGDRVDMGSQKVITHSLMSAPSKPVVFSWKNMEILKAHTNPKISNTFYSICIDKAQNRAVVTLHVLLNKEDSALMEELCNNIDMAQQPTLAILFDKIENKIKSPATMIALTKMRELCAGLRPQYKAADLIETFLAVHKFNPWPSLINKPSDGCYGHTALTKAIELKLPEIYNALADRYKADLNAKNAYGNTALHMAVSSQNEEAILWLLDRKVDTKITNNFAQMPIDIAKAKGFKRIACILFLYENKFGLDKDKINNFNSSLHTPLTTAVRSKDFVMACNLVEAYAADVNARNGVGNTAVHIAIMRKDDALIAYLISKGASTDIANDEKKTAHMLAKELEVTLPALDGGRKANAAALKAL